MPHQVLLNSLLRSKAHSIRSSCCRRLTRSSFHQPHHKFPPTSRLYSMATGANMVDSNRLRQALRKGEKASVGVWQMLPGANVSRTLARTPGVDWVMVDCEHGNIDDAAMHEAVPAIAATGVSPVVRIPDTQPWMIKRALDAGAHGILVPLIRTAEEVKAVMSAAHFPPEGKRGFGSPLPMHCFNPAPTMTEYLQQANKSIVVMVQIETAEALEAVDEIAKLVDLVFIGPFVLGNNIGHPILHGVVPPKLTEAISNILKATKAAGCWSGVFCTSGEQAKMFADMGFDLVSAATDLTLLGAAVAGQVADANGTAKPSAKGTY